MNSNTNQSAGDNHATAERRLRRSTRSTRLARPIDPPYWESAGFDRTMAMNMANFTHYVSKRFYNEHRDFELPFPHGGDRFVPFHEQLLPHWRVFMRLLQQDTEENGAGNLSISDLQIPKLALDMIAPAISNMPRLRALKLEHNKLDRDGFLAVADILRHQHAIELLALPCNNITCIEYAEILSSAVRDHPLVQIQLSKCDLGRNEKVLQIILEGCKNINYVDIRHNDIASQSVDAVASFIAKNHDKVKTLDLEGNAFSDEDVPQLVTALKMNTNLRMMDITDNNLSEEGRVEMVKAVFDTTSLNDVVKSNHSCHLSATSTLQPPTGMMSMFFSLLLKNCVPFEEEMQTINDMGVSKEAKIQYKVLQVLQHATSNMKGEVNLHCLDDVPVKCMPRVLELVQKL